MKKPCFTLLIVSASILGCSTPPPTSQDLAAANYGPYPQQYKALIANYLQATLREPGSAAISAVPAPVKAYAGVKHYTYGWATCMGVNAKNGYGGYTGANTYFFLFRDGSIAVVERAGATSTPFEIEYVTNLCKRLA